MGGFPETSPNPLRFMGISNFPPWIDARFKRRITQREIAADPETMPEFRPRLSWTNTTFARHTRGKSDFCLQN
jgi:hypothetical protein